MITGHIYLMCFVCSNVLICTVTEKTEKGYWKEQTRGSPHSRGLQFWILSQELCDLRRLLLSFWDSVSITVNQRQCCLACSSNLFIFCPEWPGLWPYYLVHMLRIYHPLVSLSQVLVVTGVYHCTWLCFLFLLVQVKWLLQ